MIVKHTLSVAVYYFSYPKARRRWEEMMIIPRPHQLGEGMKQAWLLVYVGTVLRLYSAITALLIKF